MNWTLWKSPRAAVGVEADEINFTNSQARNLRSVEPVRGIATSFGSLNTDESTAIVFSDFEFNVNNELVSHVEVELHVSRLGRVQDKVIALWFDGVRRKANLANLAAEDRHVYSGLTKDWRAGSNIDYNSPQFGVYVDLQPHTQYPSNNTVYIRSVRVRLGISSD